jgi:poly(3-hydroxybutyrate) depolymerase
MAVQFAVAHSRSILGVAAIASPPWGCADGSVTQAINSCMCGSPAPTSRLDAARSLAASGAIDPLSSGRPSALRRAFVFHSPADRTVAASAGAANAAFLGGFIGVRPTVDLGNATDGSDHAGHGFLAPTGSDGCRLDGRERTYVRRCGAEDNARDLLHALYPEIAQDPARRVSVIPPAEIWSFDQAALIELVKASRANVSPDELRFSFVPWSSQRRKNLDMAAKGYLYVPPSCREPNARCRVHVALHGCKQDAATFAREAGYNQWAEHYRMIVVYPAIEPGPNLAGEACSMRLPAIADYSLVEPNVNGCWDWWGYLDSFGPKNRYLTKEGPQMRVIEHIVRKVTSRDGG